MAAQMEEPPRKKCKISHKTSQLANNLYEHRDESGDVTFIVESERIRAHRNVLAALSEKYRAQFYGEQPDEGDIQVDGVSAAAFKEYLKLFYFDDVKLSIEHIGDVLDLSKQSLVDDFVNECIEFLKRKMTTDNVCSVYRLANVYDLKELKGLCEQKIGYDTKELFATDDFVHCDCEMLVRISSLDSLSCTEGEVFDACISWVRAVCEAQNRDDSKSANLRAILGDAITQVRFTSMTLKEFAVRQTSLKDFFTLEETNEIICMIAEVDAFQSQNFNQTRRKQIRRFECNRISRPRESEHLHAGYERMIFRSTKSILLHGFVIASDVVNAVAVETKNSEKEWEMLQVSIKKAQDETIIFLTKPITCKPNNWDAFRITLNEFKGRSFSSSYGRGDVICSNGISFIFGDTFSLVSRLLFTREP